MKTLPVPFEAIQMYANVPVVCCLACKVEMLTLLEQEFGHVTFACMNCTRKIHQERNIFDLSKSYNKLRAGSFAKKGKAILNTLEQLRTLIKDSGVSQRVIAEKTGVTQQTIENIVSGKCKGVNSCTADAVAEALGKKFVLVDSVPEICQELLEVE